MNISPIPKNSQVDYITVKHSISKSNHFEKNDAIRLIDCDFLLEENQLEFLNVNRNSNPINNLNMNCDNHDDDKNKKRNYFNIINNIDNKNQQNKNCSTKVINTQHNKNNSNVPSSKITFLKREKNEDNLKSKNETKSMKNDKIQAEDHENNLEFQDLKSNKISLKNSNNLFTGADKISTVFFNSNNFKTNNFETIEIIKENFESLGYTNQFDSLKQDEARISKMKKENIAYNYYDTGEEKMFELKEDMENSAELNNEGKEENNKSFDSFYSERLKLSKILRQNKISFVSVNALPEELIIQTQHQNRINNKNEIETNNNNNFEFTLKKKRNLNQGLVGINLNAVSGIEQSNNDKKKKSLKYVKKNSLGSEDSKKNFFRTIEKDKNNNKLFQNYRKKFVDEDNIVYFNSILNSQLSSQNNINIYNNFTIQSEDVNKFNSNKLMKYDYYCTIPKNNKDFGSISEKTEKSRKLKNRDSNGSVKNIPFGTEKSKNKILILNKEEKKSTIKNSSLSIGKIDGDVKRKKIKKSNSLADFPYTKELNDKYNLSSKNPNKITQTDNKNKKDSNKKNVRAYLGDVINNIETKNKNQSAKAVISTNTYTSNATENSNKRALRDDPLKIARSKKGVLNKSLNLKSEESKIKNSYTLTVKKHEESAKDLGKKNLHINNTYDINQEDYKNKNKKDEYNCNPNKEFVLNTQNNDLNYSNQANESNVSVTEDKNSEAIKINNTNNNKKTKQLIEYNKVFNYDKNKNGPNNCEKDFDLLKSINNIKNLNEHEISNIFKLKNVPTSSHKRTQSEALDYNKKSDFDYLKMEKTNRENYKNNKLLNSTSLQSNSKDLIENPNNKMNKIRELSLGKFMNVFIDVDNEKSNISHQSSRKNSRINEIQNQTEGNILTNKNRFSPHNNILNKNNGLGYSHPEEILNSLNTNQEKNFNLNTYCNLDNKYENSLNNSNFISNFTVNNTVNYNKNFANGNNNLNKNCTLNSFRYNYGVNNSMLTNVDKIKNIFS